MPIEKFFIEATTTVPQNSFLPATKPHFVRFATLQFLIASSGDKELKKKMDVVNGVSYLGFGACMGAVSPKKDGFPEELKMFNMGAQALIGAMYLKRGLEK